MLEIREGFPDFAWPIAWSWIEGRRGVFDDYGPKTDVEFVERYLVVYQNGKTFGIWENGRIGGVIGFEWNSPTCVTAHILVSKRLWGKSNSEQFREAARLMFEAAPDLLRIQAFVPTSNRLAAGLAKRMGARSEGILRDATMQGGKPVDVELLGLTRRDFFEEVKDGTELRRVEQQIDSKSIDVGEYLGHVLSAAIGTPVDAPERVQQPGPGDDDRATQPERRGGGDGKRGRDKQNGNGHGNKDSAVPRIPRIRGKRTVGAGGTGKPASNVKQPRGKRVSGRRPAA